MSNVVWRTGISLIILGIIVGFGTPCSLYAAEIAGEVVSVDGSVFVRPDGKEVGRKLSAAKPGDKVFSGDVVNTPSNGKIKILMKDKTVVDIGPSALFKMDQFAMNGGKDRQADVTMMYGTMRAAVTQKIEGKGRFRVRTAAATMGVRGTEFVVKSEIPDMEHLRALVLGKPMPSASAPEPQKKGDPKKPEVKRVEQAKTEITVLQGQVDVVKEAPKPKEGDKKDSRAPAAAPQVVSLTAGTQLTTKQNDIAPAKPVILDAKQLTSITKEVRMMDNTFSKSVSIDPASSDSSALHAVLSEVVAAAPVEMVQMSDIGVAGTFGVESTFTEKPAEAGPVYKTLRITVRWANP